jgi:leucyl/phenylalanyl-tRNA---protein transferase
MMADMIHVPLLDGREPAFPPPQRALRDPDGLLAMGGELTVPWLLAAYRRGIFPWFNDDRGPVLWWSPDPRAVLFPHELRVSRRLQRTLRSGRFTCSIDRAFDQVVEACAAPRTGQQGTWITRRMRLAYRRMHEAGYAHSIEVWHAEELVGGLYGLSLGRMFFGESMFHRRTDASKVALVTLTRLLGRWGFTLLDCQVMNPHLHSLGAREIPRSAFLQLLEASNRQPTRIGRWSLDEEANAGSPGQ